MTNRPVASGDNRDDDFQAALASWDQRMIQAVDELDPATPSPAVWQRISRRLDEMEGARATLTVSSSEGVWEHLSPGVHRKLLYVDAEAGWQAFLLSVEPGAGLQPHRHTQLEECLVLEGEFEVDGAVVRKGDLHLGFAGHDHSAITSSKGTLLYIRAAARQAAEEPARL